MNSDNSEILPQTFVLHPSLLPDCCTQGLTRLGFLYVGDNGVGPAAMEGLTACMRQGKGLTLLTADSDDEEYADYYEEEYYGDLDYEDGAGALGGEESDVSGSDGE